MPHRIKSLDLVRHNLTVPCVPEKTKSPRSTRQNRHWTGRLIRHKMRSLIASSWVLPDPHEVKDVTSKILRISGEER